MSDDARNSIERPRLRPVNSKFMSGPAAKRPGYVLGALDTQLLGRSRRTAATTARRREVIERSRSLLGMPSDWQLALVPGSDMGAMEMAMWSLLGPRPVDALAYERFGHFWAADVIEQLNIPQSRLLEAPFGSLPDLAQVNWEHDVVFVWSGTTAGVRIPDASWIPEDRGGLAICDATSAAFAMPLPWERLDVVTWSWQKAMGGEGGHGMLAVSPRALSRLETHRPAWPIPKLLRMAEGGKPIRGLFTGESVNTPSQLCVEDALDGLRWAERIGGLPALLQRTQANFDVIATWVQRTPWVRLLAETPAICSPTSPCLVLDSAWYRGLDRSAQARAAKDISARLAAEGVAYDIDANPSAPPGLRIWCGPTIETADLEALLPWLEWSYAQTEALFTSSDGESQGRPMP